MTNIGQRFAKPARYVRINRHPYYCPKCGAGIIRDRKLDIYKCWCGFSEPRNEYTITLRMLAEKENQKRIDWELDKKRTKWLTENGATTVVYYIEFLGAIKIGTTRNLYSRMSSLPWDTIHLVEPGDKTLEMGRHKQFAEDRISHEYFTKSDELMSFIDTRRKEIQERNARVYSMCPPFPWAKGKVSVPQNRAIAQNLTMDDIYDLETVAE